MTKPRAATVNDALELSPPMRETFAQAEELIRKTYGDSPPAETLLRLWILSATSLAVMEEFEEAVMDTGERPSVAADPAPSTASALTL